jgi:hypothetical protein
MPEKVHPIKGNLVVDPHKQAMEELSQIDSITFTLTPAEALATLSHLQLALRHPGAAGPGSDLARNVAKVIQGSMLAEPGSALEFMLEAGWQAEFDITKT